MSDSFTLEQWRIMRQNGRTNLIWLCQNVLGYDENS